MPERLETLTMSQKERDRLTVLARVKQGELTRVLAAQSLGISERQIYRILHRQQAEGDRGVIHRLRGRPRSNRSYPEEVRAEVIRLFHEQYSDYDPTLLSEMLLGEHQIDVSRQTLSRWLRAEGVRNGIRKKRPHRKKRERREAIGDLLQFDGSHHDWFEGRGPACCLLVAIDDASGRVFLRFAESENTKDVLLALRCYVERFGIPRQFYTDYGAVYNVPPSDYRHHGTSNGLPRLTDVGRALKRLGIEHIFARSPQAKGRVERSNRTHQDRLIKALRRHSISTIAQANEFLDCSYSNDHNKRFARGQGLGDMHRSAERLDFNNIFCYETIRHVYNDYTITLNNQFIQLERSANKATLLPAPRQSVTVRRWLDDSLHIFWHHEELSFTPLSSRPLPQPKQNPGLAATHPWRHKCPIGPRGHRLQEQRTKLIKTKNKSLSSIPSPP